MEVYIAIAAVAFIIGFWNLMIAVLGCFPQFLSTAVGTLTKASTKRNVRTKHGHVIPFLTKYAYIYTVNGKEYKYSSENYHSKRRLFPKATMVYVKWFPHRAYPDKFVGTTEWILGIIMLFMSIMCVYSITATK